MLNPQFGRGFTLFLHRRRIWRSSTFWSRSWTKARKARSSMCGVSIHLVGPWPGEMEAWSLTSAQANAPILRDRVRGESSLNRTKTCWSCLKCCTRFKDIQRYSKIFKATRTWMHRYLEVIPERRDTRTLQFASWSLITSAAFSAKHVPLENLS
jgi:hypothetical protein